MWQPDNTLSQRIVDLIGESITGTSNNRQKAIAQELNHLSTLPDFSCYLALILRHPSLPLNTRLSSGHYLKSLIERQPKPLPDNPFFEDCILDALKFPEVAAASASISSTLYTAKDGWPKLLDLIRDNLDADLCLQTLFQILQDTNSYAALAHMIDNEPYYGLYNQIIPILMMKADASSPLAIKCINQLAVLQPRVFMQYTPRYLDLLLHLANANSPCGREISEGFYNLSCSRKDLVSKRFEIVALYMINRIYTGDKDSILFFSEWKDNRLLILKLLPQLLKALLVNLKLTEEDLMEMMTEKGYMRLNPEDTTTSNSTPRTESGSLLDNLAEMYGDQCFHELQNTLIEMMGSQDWILQEAGILALGSISIGCENAIKPSLPTLLPYLLAFADSPQCLIRAMSMWTYTRLIAKSTDYSSYIAFLPKLFKELAGSEFSSRQSACSAICILVSHYPGVFSESLEQLLVILNNALPNYKGRIVLNLLDVIGSLAENLQQGLATPTFCSVTLPLLYRLWEQTSIDNRLIWTLCETFTCLFIYVSSTVDSLSAAILERCVQIIQLSLPPVDKEKDFAIKSLELAGTILDFSENTFNLAQLASLVTACLGDKDVILRQYAAAVAGGLVIAGGAESVLPTMIERLMDCLKVIAGNNSEVAYYYGMCCNNAAGTLGEIAVRYPNYIQNIVLHLVTVLLQILYKKFQPEQAKGNIVVAIGKLGVADPLALVNALDKVFEPWCFSIMESPPSSDKEASTRGVLLALSKNPSILDTKFDKFAEAMVKYENMPPAIERDVICIMQGVKQFAGERWEAYTSTLPFRDVLLTRFKV